MKNIFKILLIITLSCLINDTYGLKEEDCEGKKYKFTSETKKYNVVNKFRVQFNKVQLEDEEFVSKEFKAFCKTIALSNASPKLKENSFCYLIGGSEISATSMLKKFSNLISYLPTDRVCFRLDKDIGGICALRYEKTFDLKSLSNEEIKKLKARDLKKIISNFGEECENCIEKSDIVKVVLKLKEKQLNDEL